MTYGGIKGNAPRVRKLRTGCGRTARFTLGPLSSRIFSGDKETIDSVAFVHSPFLKTLLFNMRFLHEWWELSTRSRRRAILPNRTNLSFLGKRLDFSIHFYIQYVTRTVLYSDAENLLQGPTNTFEFMNVIFLLNNDRHVSANSVAIFGVVRKRIHIHIHIQL